MAISLNSAPIEVECAFWEPTARQGRSQSYGAGNALLFAVVSDVRKLPGLWPRSCVGILPSCPSAIIMDKHETPQAGASTGDMQSLSTIDFRVNFWRWFSQSLSLPDPACVFGPTFPPLPVNFHKKNVTQYWCIITSHKHHRHTLPGEYKHR